MRRRRPFFLDSIVVRYLHCYNLSVFDFFSHGFGMNAGYRALISLTTVLPLSITFSYLYAGELESFFCGVEFYREDLPIYVRLFWVFEVSIFNALAGAVVVQFLKIFARKSGKRPVKVSCVKELGGDALLSYMPYVLPLFVAQSENQAMMGWGIGFVLLFLLSWSSMTVSFSPLLRLCGVRFFEATLVDGKVVTLLIDNEEVRPLALKCAVKVSDNCYYGLK